MTEPGANERLAALRHKYLQTLAGGRPRIAQLWEQLRLVVWQQAAAGNLRGIAHKLAGSSASFGYPEVGQAARAVDEQLGDLVDGGRAPGGAEMQRLAQCMDVFLEVIGRTLQAAPEGVLAAEPPVLALTQEMPAGSIDIVIIDDDELLGQKLEQTLSGLGYGVRAFREPAAALAALRAVRENPPALVLLDLMFPQAKQPMFSLVADIRAATGVRTPVIVMSGRGDFAARLEGVRVGADGWLPKPFSDEQLEKTVAARVARDAAAKLRCLVVDDDGLFAAQLVEWLRAAGMIADAVSDPRQSWQRLLAFRPDVLLLDIDMPECNGLEVAALVRQDPATAALPILFLTASENPENRRQAMSLGADDYLSKPIAAPALVEAVQVQARRGRETAERLSRLVRRSTAAGSSRYFFFERLEQEIDAATDTPLQPALVLFALHEGAVVAAQYGASGVAEIQEQVQHLLDGGDGAAVAALGDNAFGLLLARDALEAQRARVQSLLQALGGEELRVQDNVMRVRASASLLRLGPGEYGANAALQSAEKLLVRALARGAAALEEGVVSTAGMSADGFGIRESLPVDRLRLVYQQAVTIDGSGDAVSSVLARMIDDDGDLLPAGRFLEALVRRGWLPELDSWVTERVHALLRRRAAGDAPLTLIVNLGRQTLTSDTYATQLNHLLQRGPLQRHRLLLAVAEPHVLTHRPAVQRLAEIARRGGAGLALVDYGSTNDSVAVVEALRPVFVRLDRARSQRLAQTTSFSPSDRTLIDAATGVGAEIVAGGIEDARSLSALWSKGVRRFQGYFIQEPDENPGAA